MTDLQPIDRPDAAAPTHGQLIYTLPADPNKDWASCKEWAYQPTARQPLTKEI